MVITFTREATGYLPLRPDEVYDQEEYMQKISQIVNDGDADKYECDYFFEIPAPTTPKTRFRCFGGPFTVERSEVDYCFERVYYRATQRCLFFADDIADFDTAITMACVASASDCVEQSISINKTPNRWEIRAPQDIPAIALIACYKDYGPAASKTECFVERTDMAAASVK